MSLSLSLNQVFSFCCFNNKLDTENLPFARIRPLRPNRRYLEGKILTKTYLRRYEQLSQTGAVWENLLSETADRLLDEFVMIDNLPYDQYGRNGYVSLNNELDQYRQKYFCNRATDSYGEIWKLLCEMANQGEKYLAKVKTNQLLFDIDLHDTGNKYLNAATELKKALLKFELYTGQVSEVPNTIGLDSLTRLREIIGYSEITDINQLLTMISIIEARLDGHASKSAVADIPTGCWGSKKYLMPLAGPVAVIRDFLIRVSKQNPASIDYIPDLNNQEYNLVCTKLAAKFHYFLPLKINPGVCCRRPLISLDIYRSFFVKLKRWFARLIHRKVLEYEMNKCTHEQPQLNNNQNLPSPILYDHKDFKLILTSDGWLALHPKVNDSRVLRQSGKVVMITRNPVMPGDVRENIINLNNFEQFQSFIQHLNMHAYQVQAREISQFCSELTGVNDTIVHYFNHHKRNLWRGKDNQASRSVNRRSEIFLSKLLLLCSENSDYSIYSQVPYLAELTAKMLYGVIIGLESKNDRKIKSQLSDRTANRTIKAGVEPALLKKLKIGLADFIDLVADPQQPTSNCSEIDNKQHGLILNVRHKNILTRANRILINNYLLKGRTSLAEPRTSLQNTDRSQLYPDKNLIQLLLLLCNNLHDYTLFKKLIRQLDQLRYGNIGKICGYRLAMLELVSAAASHDHFRLAKAECELLRLCEANSKLMPDIIYTNIRDGYFRDNFLKDNSPLLLHVFNLCNRSGSNSFYKLYPELLGLTIHMLLDRLGQVKARNKFGTVCDLKLELINLKRKIKHELSAIPWDYYQKLFLRCQNILENDNRVCDNLQLAS